MTNPQIILGAGLFTFWCVFILWLATSKPNPKVVDLPKNRRVLPKPRTPARYLPDEERGGYQPKTPTGTILPPPRSDGRDDPWNDSKGNRRVVWTKVRRDIIPGYWFIAGVQNKPCDPMWPNELVLAGKLGHAVGLCSGEGVAEI